MKIEKEKNTNTSAGIETTPEGMAPENGVLSNNISRSVYTIFGSTDSELQELAEEPLFKMYAEVGPEIYEMISRTNPILKAVIDMAKQICGGDQ